MYAQRNPKIKALVSKSDLWPAKTCKGKAAAEGYGSECSTIHHKLGHAEGHNLFL